MTPSIKHKVWECKHRTQCDPSRHQYAKGSCLYSIDERLRGLNREHQGPISLTMDSCLPRINPVLVFPSSIMLTNSASGLHGYISLRCWMNAISTGLLGCLILYQRLNPMVPDDIGETGPPPGPKACAIVILTLPLTSGSPTPSEMVSFLGRRSQWIQSDRSSSTCWS